MGIYRNFKFYNDTGKRFYNLKQYATLLEFPPHSAFTSEEEKGTGIYKLLSKSNIFESVTNNEFQIKNDKNISKIKGIKSRLYSFYCNDIYLTGYYTDNRVYIAKGHDKNLGAYCLDPAQVEDGFIFLNRNSQLGKTLKKLYLNNMFIYENLETKNNFMEVISHVI